MKDEEHFNSLVTEGNNKLTVIDLHTNWCGPCALLANTFRSIAMKIDDWELRVQFLVLDSERVSYYREAQTSSQPKFLFFVGSKQVAMVEGVNVPLIQQYINRYIPSLDN